MKKVIVYKGKRGASEVDGIDGLGAPDIQAEKLESPVFDVLCTNKLSRAGSIEFDRGSLASHNNRHHKNVWARSTNTTNFNEYSEDMTQWTDFDSLWTIIGTTADPFGGTEATEINLDADTDDLVGLGNVMERTTGGTMVVGGYVTISFYFKIISGTISAIDLNWAVETYPLITPTTSYQHISISVPVLGTAAAFSINPRGKLGARFAITRIQVEDNHTVTPYIKTEGTVVTNTFLGEIERESDKGWLVEGDKENAVIYSADLSRSQWIKTNLTIDSFAGLDPFGETDQNIRLVWSTVQEVSLSGDTGTLTPSTQYTVSFWAYITAGSLSSLTVSLGGGAAVEMPVVSVTGFSRISAAVTSGASTGIVISATSPNLTANLNISGIQAELGELTSYVKTGTLAQTRLADILTANTAFNIPRPDKEWSFIFRHVSVLNNSQKKYVFTNNETGSTEFSCYFSDANMTLKNGASETSVSALAFEKIAITFDGSTINIYNESTLLATASITPTSFLSTGLYIGMDSAKANAINAHLSNFMFYDVKLSLNDIKYLMGS